MAIWPKKDDPTTGGGFLIRRELEAARFDLSSRRGDLEEATKRVVELKEACERLSEKVGQLEHDEKALIRGHIALMCDNQDAIDNLEREMDSASVCGGPLYAGPYTTER